MSKCRPSCCSGNSSDGGAVAIIGVIVLGLAVYGIVRTILHVLITIVEIAAIVVGSIGALILVAFITIRIMKYIPSGQARIAASLKNPLAIAPIDSPKNASAPTARSGAAQHMAIGSTPLSNPFPCILQATESFSASTSALDALP